MAEVNRKLAEAEMNLPLNATKSGEIARGKPSFIDLARRVLDASGYPTKLELGVFLIALVSCGVFAYGLAHQVYQGVASVIAVLFTWFVYRGIRVVVRRNKE